jgi:hypothetical protein
VEESAARLIKIEIIGIASVARIALHCEVTGNFPVLLNEYIRYTLLIRNTNLLREFKSVTYLHAIFILSSPSTLLS